MNFDSTKTDYRLIQVYIKSLINSSQNLDLLLNSLYTNHIICNRWVPDARLIFVWSYNLEVVMQWLTVYYTIYYSVTKMLFACTTQHIITLLTLLYACTTQHIITLLSLLYACTTQHIITLLTLLYACTAQHIITLLYTIMFAPHI